LIKIVVLSTFLSLALVSGPSFAEPKRPGIDAQIATLAERLALTEEQVEAIRPTLDKFRSRRVAIMEQYGVDPEHPESIRQNLNRREARKLMKDMRRARDEMEDSLADILSDEQMAEYREIQAERREAIRSQYRG